MGFTQRLRGSILRTRTYALQSQREQKNQNEKTKMLDGSEKSMMPIILAHQKSIIRDDQAVFACEEFSAGTGIADVVMFSVDDDALSQRLAKKHTAITDYRLLSTYLAIIKEPGLAEDSLINSLPFPKQSMLRDTLPTLIREGLIERVGLRLYGVAGDIQTPVVKCVAIEAKVKDWRSGIKQACRYKEFADETYLAIYKQHSSVPMANIGLFQALGVGLLIVDNGYVELVQSAGSNNFKDINRLLASERLVSTLDDFNQPFMSRIPFAPRSF